MRWARAVLRGDPTLFPLDDSGYSTLQDHVIGEEEEELVRQGVAACPEIALSIDDA
jgi:ferredoxin